MQAEVKKRLVLVELNEVNFDIALAYAKRDGLRNLKRILDGGLQRTVSEASYEELEPWIQWVSAHTGKTAAEHGIFRLGDIVGSGIPQFFEEVEQSGFSVGNVSAMNAENRLKNPAYFIPDPWTATAPDSAFWSKAISAAVSQAVNDNASSRLSGKSMLALIGGLFRFAQFAHYPLYLKLASRSRGAPWRKALFLDLFLHDIHLNLFNRKNPNLSTVFLNAGAHIQHHYLFNAKEVDNVVHRNPEWYVPPEVDPVSEMLAIYDVILGDYLAMDGVDIIVATGLTQKPYNRVKYYWRLNKHQEFMERIGIVCSGVFPRMTRDVLLEFDSADAALQAAELLSGVVCEADGMPIFGEIDNRGLSLFVTLTYSGPIEGPLMVRYGDKVLDLKPHVCFVAIKNGMHDANGFIYFKGNVERYSMDDFSHIRNLHSVILDYFGIARCALDNGMTADLDLSK